MTERLSTEQHREDVQSTGWRRKLGRRSSLLVLRNKNLKEMREGVYKRTSVWRGRVIKEPGEQRGWKWVNMRRVSSNRWWDVWWIKAAWAMVRTLAGILSEMRRCWRVLSKSDVIFYLFIFGWVMCHMGSQFLNQESIPCLLQWKPGVLTTGPPGNSDIFSKDPSGYSRGNVGSRTS